MIKDSIYVRSYFICRDVAHKVRDDSKWLQNMGYHCLCHSMLLIVSAMSLRRLSLSAFTKTSLVAYSWLRWCQSYSKARALWCRFEQVSLMLSNVSFRTLKATLRLNQSRPIISATKCRIDILMEAAIASHLSKDNKTPHHMWHGPVCYEIKTLWSLYDRTDESNRWNR